MLYDKFLNEWSEQWFQFIKDNPMEKWNYYYISMSENVTWHTVCTNLNNPWEYNWLSENPNISLEIIYANPSYDWNDELTTKYSPFMWDIIRHDLKGDCVCNELYKSNSIWEKMTTLRENNGHCHTLIDETCVENVRNQYIRQKFQDWFKKSDLKMELIGK